MAKASLTLDGGTTVVLEGTTDEVHRLLVLYGQTKDSQSIDKAPTAHNKPQASIGEPTPSKDVDLAALVNHVKSCAEAEQIEKKILDRSARIPRILMPMYVAHQHIENSVGLTSGDISRVTGELGIPIHTANVSKVLSGTASKYVMGDKVRKQGLPVRYRLSRRGVEYIKGVLDGK